MTTLQQINLGTPPSAVDGDTARTAFGKVNANFAALQSIAANTITSPQDGDLLQYNAATGQWANYPGADEDGFIDGNFDSWQVGTTFSVTPTTSYTADMWRANSGPGGAATVSQVAATPGGEPAYMVQPRRYLLQYQQTTASTASGYLGQRIEGVSRYNGKTITVSGSFSSPVAGNWITGVWIYQSFGTGGSPSPAVSSAPQPVSWAITPTEARFSVNISVPSIAGMTLGTNGDDCVGILLNFASGATFTLRMSQLQIDTCNVSPSAAPTPKPFRYDGLPLTQVKVGRYLAKLCDNVANNMGTAFMQSAGVVQCPIYTNPPMRVNTPALLFTGGATVANLVVGGGTTGTTTGASFAPWGSARAMQLLANVPTATAGYCTSMFLANTTGSCAVFADARI